MTPLDYLKKNEKKRLDDLFRFLSYASVSAKSEHKKDIADCATWLRDHLKKVGFKARTYPTGGHPVVYGEYLVDKKLPTVLYYGHYDVQPPEPLDLWKSPPFKPVLRGGYIWGRGSADNKGQLFTHVKGLEAILGSTGTLPVNVKLLFEGEEEVHSEHLPAWIRKNKKMLKADIAVVSDTSMFGKNLPTVTFGLRGIAAIEAFVYGPKADVHSGGFGGAIANPANVLGQMIARLHDKNGKIAIPGFYKGVKPVSKWERTQFRKLPFSKKKYLSSLGVPDVHGEKGYTTLERSWSRPTCDVNGITSGYQGEGAKTIIPSYASCKITMRLVPGQDPKDICNRAATYLQRIAPKSVRVKVDKLGGAKAVEVPSEGPWLEAAGRALMSGFGKEPLFAKEGGSIPIVGDFKGILGLDTLLIGFCQSDDNVHSPNERFSRRDFERGCKTAAALPFELAKAVD
jgi:acetylornithine deacetylase/succinyl-diaminopimelate desuccinylase-like protein